MSANSASVMSQTCRRRRWRSRPGCRPRRRRGRRPSTRRRRRRSPIALAVITRPRCGTSVNVVSPLRWLHSLVTERIATIGRIDRHREADRGGEGLVGDWSSSGAKTMVAAGREHGQDADARHQPEAGAGVEHLAQLDPDHPAHRDRAYGRGGPGPGPRRRGPRWWRSGWSCCCSFVDGLALGLGGELEEHLLQAGAVGGAQLGQGDAGRQGDPADGVGVGVGAERAARRRPRRRCRRRPSACGQPGDVGGRRRPCRPPRAAPPWCPGRRSGRCRSRRGRRRSPRSRAAGARRAARCRPGRRTPRSRSRIQRMPAGSRPLAGSSRISTAGSPMSAVAMPSRWRMPSE